MVRREETIKKLTKEFTGGIRTLKLFIDTLILITYFTFYVLISQAVRNIKLNYTVRTFN